MGAKTRMAMRVAVTVGLLALLVPVAAFAQDSVAHRTVVSQVSGAQIAQQIIGQVKNIQLGSSGATLSVGVMGEQHPVHIDYPNVAGAAGTGASGGDIGGLARLFAIPVLGGVALRLVSTLARLGRG